MRGKIKELLFITITMFLPFPFLKKISTKQNIASREIAYQFLAPKVSVLRRNKATNSSTSTYPFSAATKTLVFGNLFKLVRFAIRIRTGSLPLGIMRRIRRLPYFSSSLSPSGRLLVPNRHQNKKSLRFVAAFDPVLLQDMIVFQWMLLKSLLT